MRYYKSKNIETLDTNDGIFGLFFMMTEYYFGITTDAYIQAEEITKSMYDDAYAQSLIPEYTVDELRKQAYATTIKKMNGENLIEYGVAIYSCDSAYEQLAIYKEEDIYAGTTKAQELGLLWANAKEYIRSLDIDELKQLLTI